MSLQLPNAGRYLGTSYAGSSGTCTVVFTPAARAGTDPDANVTVSVDFGEWEITGDTLACPDLETRFPADWDLSVTGWTVNLTSALPTGWSSGPVSASYMSAISTLPPTPIRATLDVTLRTGIPAGPPVPPAGPLAYPPDPAIRTAFARPRAVTRAGLILPGTAFWFDRCEFRAPKAGWERLATGLTTGGELIVPLHSGVGLTPAGDVIREPLDRTEARALAATQAAEFIGGADKRIPGTFTRYGVLVLPVGDTVSYLPVTGLAPRATAAPRTAAFEFTMLPAGARERGRHRYRLTPDPLNVYRAPDPVESSGVPVSELPVSEHEWVWPLGLWEHYKSRVDTPGTHAPLRRACEFAHDVQVIYMHGLGGAPRGVPYRLVLGTATTDHPAVVPIDVYDHANSPGVFYAAP